MNMNIYFKILYFYVYHTFFITCPAGLDELIQYTDIVILRADMQEY